MKASKRVLFSAGLGTSIAISGILGIGIIPGAFADETTTTPTTSEGGTSSVSTAQTTSGETLPSNGTETGMETVAPSDTSASPVVEVSVESSQPTGNSDAGPSTPTTEATSPGSGNQTKGTPTTESKVAASKVAICHKPGTPAEQTLFVDDNAVQGHLGHGDTLGTCVLTGGGPAPYPDPNSETVEIWWAMPYPGTAENVTWPQNYASSDVLQCSITYQVDTYLKSEAQKFTLDGVLNLGEDYQNSTQRGAISWRFVYGGDCAPVIPPKPDDKREVLDSHDVTDCQAGFVTHIETAQTKTYVYDEQHMTWVANVALPVTTQTDRDTTEEDCPSTPTTPSSPTTPTTTPTPVSALLVPSTTATHTSVPSTVRHQPTALARTGSNEDEMRPWLLGALGVLLIVLGVAAVVRRRQHG